MSCCHAILNNRGKEEAPLPFSLSRSSNTSLTILFGGAGVSLCKSDDDDGEKQELTLGVGPNRRLHDRRTPSSKGEGGGGKTPQ